MDKFVSFLMPICNEDEYIQGSLEAVFTQDYPISCMEVIISDGLSTDRTREIIASEAEKYPHILVRILDNPSKIVPTALNMALLRAKGEIIIRVDGHCIIASDYVRKCVDHILRDGVDGIGGSIETVGQTRLAKAIAVGMSSLFGVGDSAFRTFTDKTLLVDTVPFPAYTRRILEQAGMYDEELVRNQDDEYNYRIRELGGKILLAEDVHSTYFSRGSLQDMWKQYYQYGYWKVRVLQKHPRQMRLRQFVPPVFVLTLILSVLLAVFAFSFERLPQHFGGLALNFVAFSFQLSPFSLFLSFVVPLLYILSNISASLITSMKRGWRYLPLLPLVFAILHVSYGLGFLVGLFKFWNRWNDKLGKVPAFHTAPE